MRDAIIDRTTGWLSCGRIAIAAIVGAPLTTVEAVFAMNGSDGIETVAAVTRRYPAGGWTVSLLQVVGHCV
jgi:hypothetical protein